MINEEEDGMAVKAGTRIKCRICGSEYIVLKPNDPSLICCDAAPEIIFTPPGDEG
jgi:hypothetical protein